MKKSNSQAHVKPSKKSSGDWHVSNTSMGMGDYYGTGVKQKIGKMRSPTVGITPLSPKKMKTPPKTLA